MAAKKTSKKIKKVETEATEKDPHWFPADAKAPTAATTPPKKASPWQRRQAIVNYGTLAKPGFSFKELFNNHIETKHKKLSDSQRTMLWSVVSTKMLSEPMSRLTEIIDQEAKTIHAR